MRKNKGIHAIIQARMNSTRLPGKILMPFVGDLTFLEWIVDRVQTSDVVEKVILATTTNSLDDQVESLCLRRGYDYIRGSEDDVLQRYFDAAEKFGSRIIVRVISDDPLVDIQEMDHMITVLESEGLDYMNNHPSGLPIGCGCEVFNFESFKQVHKEAKDPYEHEHVTPYYYRHPELFKQKQTKHLPKSIPTSFVRLTLDTPEDLVFLQKLAEGLSLKDPKKQLKTEEILLYIDSHPEVQVINQNIRQKTFPTGNDF